jgi:hypothetical protein
MKNGNKCYCLFAALATVVTILLITYVFGYTMGHWTAATWLASAIVVIIAVLCGWCGGLEDTEKDK